MKERKSNFSLLNNRLIIKKLQNFFIALRSKKHHGQRELSFLLQLIFHALHGDTEKESH